MHARESMINNVDTRRVDKRPSSKILGSGSRTLAMIYSHSRAPRPKIIKLSISVTGKTNGLRYSARPSRPHTSYARTVDNYYSPRDKLLTGGTRRALKALFHTNSCVPVFRLIAPKRQIVCRCCRHYRSHLLQRCTKLLAIATQAARRASPPSLHNRATSS